MAQEEHSQKCSNSSSGGGGDGGGCGGDGGGGGGCNGSRSSKKLKQKKVPQRGLGVAQLEKIRLEEQQKKEAALQAQAVNILSPNAIISPSNSSSCLGVQSLSFRPNSLIQLPPTSPRDFNSSNSLFRPSNSMPNIDVLHSNHVQFSKPLNLGGGDAGHGSWPNLMNGGYNPQGENPKVDNRHQGLSYRSNPYESNNPILPLPNLMQRSQLYQQPSSSSMVNVSSGISPSSSVVNFQMEPPSNQNYCGKNHTPFWPEEEKMVGLKRQYPFSLEIPPAPPFHSKFPSASLVGPFARSDESASRSNGSPANVEPSNPLISLLREGPSSSNTLPEPNSRNFIPENGSLDRDFLTLAPPAASSAQLESQLKHRSNSSGPSSRDFSVTSQESSEHRFLMPGVSESIAPPLFSFLPAADVHNGQAANPANNRGSESGESVDLNLKL